jgi:hypothetical protein
MSEKRDFEKGQSGDHHEPSPRESRAREEVPEPRSTVSHSALSRQTRAAARSRTGEERHEAAAKAVRTKGKTELQQAANKATRIRAKKRAA